MSNETPERLQRFRDETAALARGRRQPVYLALAAAVGGIAGAVVMALLLHAQSEGFSNPGGGMSADQWRKYAVRLEQKGLPDAAIDAYRTYLDRAQLDDAARTRVCLRVAQLAYDAEQYTDALAFLYQTDLFEGGDADRDDINRLIVATLERLGRTDDLRRELRAQTAPLPSSKPDDDDVLAEFGNETITAAAFAEQLAALPPALREKTETEEGLMELLQNMVAERLLVERAYRLGYDDDPDLKRQLTEHKDALVVQRMIRSFLEEKGRPKPEDTPTHQIAEAQEDQKLIRELIEDVLETRDIQYYPERMQEFAP